MIQGKGVQIHAYEAWKAWVDRQHEGKNSITSREQYLSMWYDNAQKTYMWKGLTQHAFLDGYEAGFTDRLFNGDSE